MEDATKDKVPNIQDYVVLKYFDDVFGEISRFPPKKDINFAINVILGVAPMS